MLYLLIVLAGCSGITGVITFVLYGRARMQEKEAQEKFYLKIHYGSLFFLFLVGMVYMFYMIEKSN